MVDYQLDNSASTPFQSRIEARTTDGILLASGTTALHLSVPEGLSSFNVVATLGDQNGNSDVTTYLVNVEAGIKLSNLHNNKTLA